MVIVCEKTQELLKFMVICFIIFPSLDGNVCDNIALSVCVSGVDVGKKNHERYFENFVLVKGSTN